MKIMKRLLQVLLGLAWLMAVAQTPPPAAPESITVVLDDNYPPYIFRDAEGQLQGILKDTWALWQQHTGIEVRLQAMNWAAAQKAMADGQADVIDTMFKTAARQKMYDFTESYASINVPLFFHQSIGGIMDARSARGFTIGVKDGDACIDVLQSHGVSDFKRYTGYSEVVAAAQAGELRVFCMDHPPAIYLLNQRGIANDFRHSDPISVGEFHRAVHKNKRLLLASVEAGFASIRQAQYQEIEQKWLGQPTSQPPDFRYAWQVLLTLTLLGLALMLWNLTLRRRVLEKTRSLSESVTTLGQTRQVLEQSLLEQNAMLNNDMVGISKAVNRVVVWANPAFAAMFGCDVAELLGKSTRQYFPSEEAFVKLGAEAYPMMAEGKIYRAQAEFVRRDGDTIWVELSGAMLNKEAGETLWVFLDITGHKAVDERLRQLSRSVEQAPVAIVITDLRGRILYANPWFTHNTGYTLAEAMGKNPRILKSGQTPPEVYVELWNTVSGGGVWQGELHNRKKNGDVFIEHAVIAPVLDATGNISHYVAIKEDITQRKQADLALQTSLREKVALLHEVHHRVKNNLQVITSLLRLEAGRSQAPDTKAVLKEMQGRIQTMALLHETLYRADSFASIALAAYLKQLATQAFRAQSGLGAAVRLTLDLTPVQVVMDQATPCGLLVNELISNCLKHAFVDGRCGEVCLRLAPTALPGQWQVVVCDDGIGLPADFEMRSQQSLGLQLVSDLTRQLGGTLQVTSDGGTTFAVTFAVTEIHA